MRLQRLRYAEDALDWHHRRNATPPSRRRVDHLRLEEWRRRNWIDVVRIIRSIRATEAAVETPAPSAVSA